MIGLVDATIDNFKVNKVIMNITHQEIYSATLSLFGCVLLIPSCILLINPQGVVYLIAVIGLITACLCLILAATIDLYKTYFIQHTTKDIVLIAKARKDITTKIYQILGAGLFFTASVMYLPFLVSKFLLGMTVADLGTWVFRLGSFAYLISSYRNACDLINSVQARGAWFKQDVIIFIAIIAFMLGALFYIAGGVVKQVNIGDPSLMSELWVIGSTAFAVGSFIFFKTTIVNS